MPKYQCADEDIERIELSTINKEKYIQVLSYGSKVENDIERYIQVGILLTYTSIKFVNKRDNFYYVFVDATEEEILYAGYCLMNLVTKCNSQLFKTISKKNFLNKKGIEELWKITLDLACIDKKKDQFLFLLRNVPVPYPDFPVIKISDITVPIVLKEAIEYINVEDMKIFGHRVYCAYKIYKAVYLCTQGQEYEHLLKRKEVFQNCGSVFYSLIEIGNCPYLVTLLRTRVEELNDQQLMNHFNNLLQRIK